MNPSSTFVFTLFTKDPLLAKQADLGGIGRIGVDLEVLGKENRQARKENRFSDHTLEDFIRIQRVLTKAESFARVNPIHAESQQEIESFIQAGVNWLMLPYFHTVSEVEKFLSYVKNRARVVLLIETPESVSLLSELIQLEGVDEVHFGLNDLRLALKLPFHFQVLTNHHLDEAFELLRSKNIPFGIAGVGYPGDSSVPIPPAFFYSQLCLLGATRTLISRSFLNHSISKQDFPQALRHLWDSLDQVSSLSRAELLELDRQFIEAVAKLSR
ncbi:HpcH/HpaI aldolase/citrate lyase family protein [Planctomycetales bacterium 10988]|nr:HpcH/HpaI aldolase/citrate lyase family protein [Planctomycetales bacterium 10988]